ncbi:kinase-like protein [Cubamyces sp. BRFM 1775]|nr:kinase-like protein [Cubamyces sp. BRFM 1775]
MPDYSGGRILPRRAVVAIEKDGVPMVLRFGLAVRPLEADITMFVAQHTSVRVPEIYGVFEDTSSGVSVHYIIEERLPGVALEDLLPTMDAATLNVISSELRGVVDGLVTLNTFRHDLGPFRGPWANHYFDFLLEKFPCGMEGARSTKTFIEYFLKAYYAYSSDQALANARIEHSLTHFDLSRPPLFTHGDLLPSNIIVHNGHITGIVDWEEAGWYPYFWNSFVVQKSIQQLPHNVRAQWAEIVGDLREEFRRESMEFLRIWNSVSSMLLCESVDKT